MLGGAMKLNLNQGAEGARDFFGGAWIRFNRGDFRAGKEWAGVRGTRLGFRVCWRFRACEGTQ